jgi:hypothetical protein
VVDALGAAVRAWASEAVFFALLPLSWLLSYAHVHLDSLRFFVYPFTITPAQNLTDLLGDENRLALLAGVLAGEKATTLIGGPSERRGEIKRNTVITS